MSVTRRILIIVALILLSACRQAQPFSTGDFTLELAAGDLRVGETSLRVSVHDSDGNVIDNPGAISVRGEMDHAGMAPVFAASDRAVDGVFELPFEWTMAGDWIVEASLKLESGKATTRIFNFEIMSEAGGDMAKMDHTDMGDRAMTDVAPGETSAVYLRIENRGEADARLVAVQSEAAKKIGFHRTVVENDIARMEPLDALTIAAGSTLVLEPGGAHIMLQELILDLQAGATCAVQLLFESGETITLEIPIRHMQMDEEANAVVAGYLVISEMWARPASAGGMRDMGHNTTAEADSE